MMKLGLVLLLAAVLAGCQASGQTPRAASHDADVARPAGSNDLLKRRLEARVLMLEYLTAVKRACYRSDPIAPGDVVIGNAMDATQECALRQVRASLGMFDIPEGACEGQAVIEESLSCLFIGSAAVRLIAAAGSNPDQMMNWLDPDASLSIGGGLLATRASLDCGRNAEASCATRQMGTALLLPAAAIDSCTRHTAQHLQTTCVAIEFLLDHIRSALLYVT